MLRLWRKVRRYELTRTLRSTEKRMEYVKKSLSYIDQVEGRIPKQMTEEAGRETTIERTGTCSY